LEWLRRLKASPEYKEIKSNMHGLTKNTRKLGIASWASLAGALGCAVFFIVCCCKQYVSISAPSARGLFWLKIGRRDKLHKSEKKAKEADEANAQVVAAAAAAAACAAPINGPVQLHVVPSTTVPPGSMGIAVPTFRDDVLAISKGMCASSFCRPIYTTLSCNSSFDYIHPLHACAMKTPRLLLRLVFLFWLEVDEPVALSRDLFNADALIEQSEMRERDAVVQKMHTPFFFMNRATASISSGLMSL
jgi:hypothetical protein